MSQPEPLSVFIGRLKSASDEYARLRFFGCSHEAALVRSGLRAAVMGQSRATKDLAGEIVAGERD
jgi:hypothetical protein